MWKWRCSIKKKKQLASRNVPAMGKSKTADKEANRDIDKREKCLCARCVCACFTQLWVESLRKTVTSKIRISQGWTGNLAYRAFSGRYMFFLNIYIYIYSSKCWWAAWTKKMPGLIFCPSWVPAWSHNNLETEHIFLCKRLRVELVCNHISE